MTLRGGRNVGVGVAASAERPRGPLHPPVPCGFVTVPLGRAPTIGAPVVGAT